MSAKLLISPVLLGGLLVLGCSESPVSTHPSDERAVFVLPLDAPCGEETTVDLIAARRHDAGDVTVSNDESTLTIRITMDPAWLLSATYAAVATSLDDIPMTRSGNPQIRKFPYKERYRPAVGVAEIEIPIDQPPGQSLFIALHARVRHERGVRQAWADGTSFPGKRWATYFKVVVQDCGGGIAVSMPDSLCPWTVHTITWEPFDPEAAVRIDLVAEGQEEACLSYFTGNTGWYDWFVEPCDDQDLPAPYRIRIINLDAPLEGESESFWILENCGGEE